MKHVLISILFISFSLNIHSQVTSDALIFSDIYQPTTARSLSLGGALGAMGGDMGTMNINPAGLGIYRGSELTISPGLQFSTINSTFVSDSLLPESSVGRSAFNFGGIGFVYAEEQADDWKFVNFSVSYNRIASFNRSFSFVGNSRGSRVVNFLQEANNSNSNPDNLDPFEEQLAWDAFLIDNPSGNNTYIGSVIDSNYIKKSQFIRQSGGINELGLTLAGNYLNKFYIGATLGIDFLKFKDKRDYTETELSNNIDFKSMKFTEGREISGTGVNLKVGFIYRINKILRMGMAVHTPTIAGLKEYYNTSLSARVIWNDTLRVVSDLEPLLSPTGMFKHNFRSPWFFNFSLGALLGKKDSKTKGFICLDADYINYSMGKFSLKANDDNATAADQEYINDVNDAVIEQYQGVARVRLGGELSMGNLRLRAGYRFQSSPYQTKVKGVSDLRHEVSFGAGIRNDNFFFDLAYMITVSDFEYAPYYPTSELNNQRINNSLNAGLLLLTFGVRF
jgi:hypothetical protein